MRSRRILMATAAVLAAVHVTGVLFGSPVWPPALVATMLLLAAYAALGGPPRWLGPVALAPLVLQAALTVPRVPTGDYGWFVVGVDPRPPPSTSSLVVDALDTGFRLAGAPLLFVAVLLAAEAARPRGTATGARVGRAATVGLAAAGVLVLAYAAIRVGDIVLDIHDRSSAGRGTVGGSPVGTSLAVGCAVLVPVGLAVTAAVLGAVTRRWWPMVGAFLVVASTPPVIDSALAAVPLSAWDGAATRLFGWDFITPSMAVPAPVPALTLGLQLTGCLLLIGVTLRVKPIRPYDG